METLSLTAARRLALARAGLLRPERTSLPTRATGAGKRARTAAHRIIERFGYLQLDTVAIAGARSHALVLLSRLEGFDPELGEALLQPGEPLFEYWGHEASWIPLSLYPAFDFRRRAFRTHPWWGDVLGDHPKVARDLLRRIAEEGPLRSAELEGEGSRGWWDLKVAKRVALALWSDGTLAIRERRAFQRSYDLAERVIPARWRGAALPLDEALEVLLLRGLSGHGWATTGTLAATWRLKGLGAEVRAALERLTEKGEVHPCTVVGPHRRVAGWIRAEDLVLAGTLGRIRPRTDVGVLLSPFDPLLWDRARAGWLFDFHHLLEIFKPAHQRRYGYFVLPVLAGERLVARVDLKADRPAGTLRVLSTHYEGEGRPSAEVIEAARAALARQGRALSLRVKGGP